MAKQLKKANKKLLRQDKQKDEFLDTVAHELKTPVTSIKAASEVLEDEDMPFEYRKRFLQNIGEDTDRLAVLIHNILDLEKLSSDQAELKMEEREVSSTIKNAINGVSQIAHKKGVAIEFQNNEIFNAHYDEDRINQVLTNLLTNSIKSVDRDNGAVKVLFNQTENDVVFSIEDNGKGVPVGEENYIFDKFYQSKNQNKKPRGSGLGLTICKKIVEGHQGKIWVDTQYDQGARFLFTIPK